jgi:hypothetical protein
MAGDISNYNMSPSFGWVPSTGGNIGWTGTYVPNIGIYPYYPSWQYYPSPCPSCGHCPTCGNHRPNTRTIKVSDTAAAPTFIPNTTATDSTSGFDVTIAGPTGSATVKGMSGVTVSYAPDTTATSTTDANHALMEEWDRKRKAEMKVAQDTAVNARIEEMRRAAHRLNHDAAYPTCPSNPEDGDCEHD